MDEVFATDLLPLWRETLGHLIHKPAETEKLGSESTDKVPGESRKCFIGVVSKTGLGVYADGMVEHDGQVGQLLAELNKLGVANNTIVIYTTDNGAELLLWPDGGMIPFHGEKNTTWDGGFRVPMIVKWPGHVKPALPRTISSHCWISCRR